MFISRCSINAIINGILHSSYFFFITAIGKSVAFNDTVKSALTLLSDIIPAFAICLSSHYVKINAANTSKFLHKVGNQQDVRIKFIVEALSLHLINNKVIFTACGFFELGPTLICKVNYCRSVYIIVLL